MSELNHVVNKDGNVDASKVASAISKISASEKERILQDFDDFRTYLKKRISMAENIGLSEEQIATIAQKVADYLSSHEEPRNHEEQLLSELWKVGTENERHSLAHMLVRLADSRPQH
ncbi:DUF3243 domain-containing protein [Cohnella soli]|uniref:DUF3243 domain-containing protein n=1 Tax=Cohnella soli TaxID=425005 RepID=A0ABW0HSW5_9BACL